MQYKDSNKGFAEGGEVRMQEICQEDTPETPFRKDLSRHVPNTARQKFVAE